MINRSEELEDFMMYYYRSGAREQLPEALEFAATSHDFPDLHARNLVLYFFARAAQLQPSVIPQCEEALKKAPKESQSFILGVLQLAKTGRSEGLPQSLEARFPVEFDVLERPITCPGDLDYLWAEFFVTGSREPVRKIINVLMWPDRVRTRFEKWLQKPALDFFSRWKRKRMGRRLQRIAGVVCDLATNNRKSVGDLDSHLLLRAKDTGFAKVRATLPFDLSQDDVHYLGTKGTARWSLSSNASMHPMVSETCQEELERQSGDAQHSLEQVIASARGEEFTEIIQPDGESRVLHRLVKLALFVLLAIAVWLVAPLTAGQSLAPFFLRVVEATPTLSLVSGIACLVLAVLGGAYRQLSSYLISRTASIPVVGEHGQEKSFVLGTYIPAWLSRKTRILTWLGVAATSTWAAGVAAAMVSTSSESEWFLVAFCFTLATRWLVSAVLVRLARAEE